MAAAPPPSTHPRQTRRATPTPEPRWRRWLVLGLFFGLGYGLTQRLMEVRWGDGSTKAPAFQPKSSPSGTPLEELRQEKGGKAKPLAADLEELARTQREQKEKQEAANQEETERKKAANEEERKRLETDRRRLEQLNNPQAPPTSEPSSPAAPQLPPPAPLPMEPTPGSQAPSEAPPTLP